MTQNNKPNNQKFRKFHRYVGNFLAGIMAVYAISGIVLIFRDTDFLKSEKTIERTLEPNMKNDKLAKTLRIRDLKINKEESDTVYFDKGDYNKQTGVAHVKVMKLPYVLDKLTHLHKAKSSDPLYWFNIFFGLALLFLVISSFWMYRPQTKNFKNGLYFTLAGIALVLIMIFV